MKKLILKKFIVSGALVSLTSAGFGSTLLFSDNFDTADTNNFDGAPVAGRQSGTLAGTVDVRAARIQQQIAGNQLAMVVAGGGSGRIRFQQSGVADRFNFGGGASGSAITNAGGMRVEFDYTPGNNTATQWLSFNVGILSTAGSPEPGLRVNHGPTDFGILFRNNGGTQRFDNGAATTTGEFGATTDQRHVIVDLLFNSFADGSDVTAISSVDGTIVDTYDFQWDDNQGAINMEFGTNAPGTLMDNLAISTLPIPEPSSALMGIIGMIGLSMRRRR